MKNIKIAFIAAILLTTSFGLVSCTEDNSSIDNTPTQVAENVSVSNWKVSLFEENGVNQTSYFSGYNFSFNTNKSVLAANGTTTVNGTWNSFYDSGSTKFVLSFSVVSGPFEEISEDWRVLTNSSTKIELRNVSGGDGSIDLLTFTRN